MKNHVSERWVLPVQVSFPIGSRQIKLDISRQSLVPVNSDQSMDKIRTGFLVPEAELENLDRRTAGRPKGRTERTRIPKRLILKFCGIGTNEQRWEVYTREVEPSRNKIATLRSTLIC